MKDTELMKDTEFQTRQHMGVVPPSEHAARHTHTCMRTPHAHDACARARPHPRAAMTTYRRRMECIGCMNGHVHGRKGKLA
eukprot:362154-Chlamydomonas_euryale.AAC.8